jgi:hypothetical protein
MRVTEIVCLIDRPIYVGRFFFKTFMVFATSLFSNMQFIIN